MDPTSATCQLEITRIFQASPDRVFAAWIDPQQVGEWIGPGEWKTKSAVVDARVGGEYRIVMGKAAQRITMAGVYREVTPPAKLVFTWRQVGDDPAMDFGDTLVTVELRDLGGTTELRLRHTGFTDLEWRDDHAAGWAECFDAIEKILVRSP